MIQSSFSACCPALRKSTTDAVSRLLFRRFALPAGHLSLRPATVNEVSGVAINAPFHSSEPNLGRTANFVGAGPGQQALIRRFATHLGRFGAHRHRSGVGHTRPPLPLPGNLRFTDVWCSPRLPQGYYLLPSSQCPIVHGSPSGCMIPELLGCHRNRELPCIPTHSCAMQSNVATL
jgi:hypothetical protein